jgi:hypothetical protein
MCVCVYVCFCARALRCAASLVAWLGATACPPPCLIPNPPAHLAYTFRPHPCKRRPQRVAIGLEASPWSELDEAEASLPLPEPMYAGNLEGINRLCVNGEALRTAAGDHDGWALVNEGDELKQKWGFVSHAPGAKLVMRVNTTRGAADGGGRVTAQLAYLKSYKGMGAAVVSCANGCDCGEARVDGYHALRQSTVYLFRLAPSEAPECHVVVRVDEATSDPDGGHKFKARAARAHGARRQGRTSLPWRVAAREGRLGGGWLLLALARAAAAANTPWPPLARR